MGAKGVKLSVWEGWAGTTLHVRQGIRLVEHNAQPGFPP